MYHHNRARLGISRCRLEECPIGAHYATMDEAKAAKSEYDQWHSTTTASIRERTDAWLADNSAGSELSDSIAEARTRLDSVEAKIKVGKGNFLYSTQRYNLSLERRNLYYAILKMEHGLRELMPTGLSEAISELEESDRAAQAESNALWFATLEPEINRSAVVSTIAAITGDSVGNVARSIGKERGATWEERARRVLSKADLREDKKLIAVDIETASPIIDGWVDRGPFSSIIEFSWLSRSADGTAAGDTTRHGVPRDYRIAQGAGATDVHGIRPEDIDDLLPLVADTVSIDDIKNLVRGNVIVSHFAGFTSSQLREAIPGLAKAIDTGVVEVIDLSALSVLMTGSGDRSAISDFTGSNPSDGTTVGDALAAMNSLLRMLALPEVEPAVL